MELKGKRRIGDIIGRRDPSLDILHCSVENWKAKANHNADHYQRKTDTGYTAHASTN
jgi:hypothetical protein